MINTPKQIKLMADYQCYPLWDPEGPEYNIAPDTLEITVELRNRIIAWANKWEATFDIDNPAASGFQTQDEEESFVNEGRKINKLLSKELGRNFKVEFRYNGKIVI